MSTKKDGKMITREQLEEKAREVGALIGSAMPEGVGFALLIFNFGESGSLAWISNAERPDMLNALREFLRKASVK